MMQFLESKDNLKAAEIGTGFPNRPAVFSVGIFQRKVIKMLKERCIVEKREATEALQTYKWHWTLK